MLAKHGIILKGLNTVKIEIKLDDPKYCNGCPILSNNHKIGWIECILFMQDVSGFVNDRKVFKRPKLCIDAHDKVNISLDNVTINKISLPGDVPEFKATYDGLEMVFALGKTENEAVENLSLWIVAILRAYDIKHGCLGNLPGNIYEELNRNP